MSKILGIITAAAISGSIVFAGSASANDKYKDTSQVLVSEASMALVSEKAEDAQLLFERALVAHPANLEALVGLGKSHEAQGRVGRGLKYYRQALAIDPNARAALEAQALAFLKRDMVDRAESNRDKLARLCSAGCEALTVVEAALDGYVAKDAVVADASTGQQQ